jgi:hypothetical protein
MGEKPLQWRRIPLRTRPLHALILSSVSYLTEASFLLFYVLAVVLETTVSGTRHDLPAALPMFVLAA